MIFHFRVLGFSGSNNFLGAHTVSKTMHIKETRWALVYGVYKKCKSLKNTDLKLRFKRCFSAAYPKLLCRYSVGMLPMCTESRNVPEILAQPLFSKKTVQIHEKV